MALKIEDRGLRIEDRGRAFSILHLLFSILVLSAGCASSHRAATQPGTHLAATRADAPPEEFLPLDQLPGKPDLAKLATTGPSTEPSLDALELYARARGALGDGQPNSAINLLERAQQADPKSFDIRFDLARTYASLRQTDEAIRNFEAAAKLRPDDIAAQTELGRQYLANGQLDRALVHLRLALQTDGYQSDDDAAAMVDYYLARTLQEKG